MSKKSRRRHGNRNNTAERRRRQERTTERDPWSVPLHWGSGRTLGSRVRRARMRPPSEMLLPYWRRVELWQRERRVWGPE